MPDLVPFDLPGGQAFALLFGLTLLLAGRRIFWLAVGVVGFFFAYDLTHRYLGAASEGLELAIALLAGIAGVILAIFLQKVAVGLAGFVIGGYLVLEAITGGATRIGTSELLIFVLAGIVCAVLALWLFETALILLSSLAGAALIEETLMLDPSASLLAFGLLVVVGVAVQTGIGPRKRRRRRRLAED